MQQKHNKKLIVKVLITGAVIAILSYLFHPGIRQLSVMLNGELVAEPLVRFAAGPTFLLIMIITGILMVLLFLGVGVFMFMFAMFAALMGIFIMAPYFWPVLIIILLMITLMTVGNSNKD
ncbi:MAG: hypothetical protein Q8L79_17255 [Methylobacter sp.]|uniref:hypothetical protein n=1 Tax=Methylobacter sp. TaxID=2051955 RepID=UPI00272F13DE|nr:hypothetical protein [Methylobacter sp.]MDP1666860.1 hypothetical protein [Methylobacter sp.]